MHKSKRNAIPFDEAAETIGADVMRWMFMAAQPAVNLNFGYGAGHEVVRRFFLPLWNTYAFFVAYARLDGWLPSDSAVADAGRSLLDRWILSRLDAVTVDVTAALGGYDALRATRAVEAFVEDLSNWYVRRNRRRFWKGELDEDKASAYATLYEVLATLTRLLAPFVPHLADAIWENLVAGVDGKAPDSVHLADFPSPPGGRRDEALEAAVERTRRIVALGHSARSASSIRVRQPLPAVRVRRSGGGALSDDPATERELTAQVLDELNVKRLELIPDESTLIERTLRPLLPVVGPRRGSAVGSIMAAARAGEWRQLDDGRVEAGGVILEPDEFELTARARPGHELAEEGDLLVALDTTLTPDLEAEGLAREVGHRLQGLRKAAGYEISDRIAAVVAGDPGLVDRLRPHRDWLAAELLADDLTLAPDATLDGADRSEELAVDDGRLRIAVRRA
jgi:isoleucyl-tRNA synthetase